MRRSPDAQLWRANQARWEENAAAHDSPSEGGSARPPRSGTAPTERNGPVPARSGGSTNPSPGSSGEAVIAGEGPHLRTLVVPVLQGVPSRRAGRLQGLLELLWDLVIQAALGHLDRKKLSQPHADRGVSEHTLPSRTVNHSDTSPWAPASRDCTVHSTHVYRAPGGGSADAESTARPPSALVCESHLGALRRPSWVRA